MFGLEIVETLNCQITSANHPSIETSKKMATPTPVFVMSMS